MNQQIQNDGAEYNEDYTTDPNPSSLISYRDVCFAHTENNTILKGVNLEIKKGEKIAIIGATGSGKSTLLLLLSRIYDTSSGEILLNGVDIKKIPLLKLRSCISYSGQDTMLFNDTIYNNITLWNENVTASQVQEVMCITAIDDFINLDGECNKMKIGDGGMCLSSGQKQCVSLARALLKESDVYILDEAMSSIDVKTKKRIIESLPSKLAEKTVIIVSHQIEDYSLFDVVYELKNGYLNPVVRNE